MKLKSIVLFSTVSILALFALAGCGSSTSSASTSAAASGSASAVATSEASASVVSGSASSSTSALFTNAEWPSDNAFGVPEPKFSVPIEDVSTRDRGADVKYVNVPEEEIVSYIEELKAAGFINEVRENRSSTMYSWDGENDAEASVSIMLMKTSDEATTLTIHIFSLR